MYFFYYYPVGVDVARPRAPWITWTLLAAMVVVHVLAHPLRALTDVAWWSYAYRPAEMDLLTPATAIFLHGGWFHLLGNALYLWVFGPALERALGRAGFLLLFVGTGYLGSLSHGAVVMNLAPEAAWSALVGASGAISGLLGLFMLRFPWGRVQIAWWAFMPLQAVNRAGVATLPSVVAVVLWVLLQVVMALVNGPTGGTSYGAHLGGLATGLFMGLALGMPWRAATERWLVKGRRHLQRGETHAAVGALRRYLERMPHDDEARLELARALRVARDVVGSSREYRTVVDAALAEQRLGEACDAYSEARRGDPVFHLPLPEQKRVAHYLEKLGREREAVTAYLDLHRFDRDHPDAVHGLVRAATILVTRLQRTEEGLELFEQARRDFPDHPLQDWLERESRQLRHRSAAA